MNKTKQYTGIGFRKDFCEELISSEVLKPAFIELAPENWIGMGGFWKKQLEADQKAGKNRTEHSEKEINRVEDNYKKELSFIKI